MFLLVMEEFELLSPCFLLEFSAFSVSCLGRLLAFPKFNDPILEYRLFILKFLDFPLLFRLAMLCLQLFPHCECGRRLVERLVRLYRHLDLVPDPQQQQTPLRLVDRHLSDYLLKTLLEQLLSDRANARLACLPLGQLLVQETSQTGNV